MAGILFQHMKKTISLLAALLTAVSLQALPGWKIHPTFDGTVTRLVDTPRFVYFTSRTQPYEAGSAYNGTEHLSLFRYDKEGEELMALSSDNVLMSANVARLDYSPEHGFMAVVDADGGVSLLYDDGESVGIAAYRYADTDRDKSVNSVWIDPADGQVTLCTAFGLVTIDPEKREIRDSRIFGAPVAGTGRAGDMQLLSMDGRLLAAPFRSRRQNLSEYEPVDAFDGISVGKLMNVDEGSCLVFEEGDAGVWILSHTDGAFRAQRLFSGPFVNAGRTCGGVALTLDSVIRLIRSDGTWEETERHADDCGLASGSYDMKEVWTAGMRRGLWSRRVNGSGEWTLTRDCIVPDAPAPFKATDMVWHPAYGLLVANHGYDPNFAIGDDGGPLLVSAYRDGRWTSLSPAYTAPGEPERLRNPNGLAVDPDNPDFLYFGSLMNGMVRIDTSDGTATVHMSRKGDPCRDLPGFVPLVEDQTGNISPLPGVGTTWTASCPFAGPRFDAYGNLWTSYADYDDQRPVKLHLICWEADARRRSVYPDRIVNPVMVKEEGVTPGNRGYVLPLLSASNRDLIVYTRRHWDGDLTVIDTNGTPSDPADDRIRTVSSFTDRDGAAFAVNDIRFIHEDPSTGELWVGHRAGVFRIDAAKLLAGDTRATRIKVARGDGTNLADYLLDGVPVNAMTEDSRGYKWFATGGAGVVCTSADGTEIYRELTSDSTPLPDDNVYGIGYMPESNSLMISTDRGLAEYQIGASTGGGKAPDVRVYPNPVRPDYLGYVTVDGLEENALVKIVDASGSLVRELGYAAGGEAKWDVTNLSGRRVATGVYYVVCTSGPDGSTVAKVGKVLVVN